MLSAMTGRLGIEGRISRATIESALLRDNPLNDPSERDVYVYVPPGGDDTTRYPVIIMLPGYNSNHRSILSYSPWKPNTLEAFDAQIRRGESKPAIVVLPDCMTRWGGSQFVDSPATGRYQSYLADEVIPFVDEHFPTIPERGARAATGRSSGGFGALRLAMDRPETVAAVASHAGDAAFEISMRPMFTSAAIAIERAGGLEAFAARLPDGGPRGSMEFDAAFVLAASAAYAIECGPSEPYCELPVDVGSGALREDVFAAWLAHDPVMRAETQAGAAALAGLSGLFIDAGLSDEHGLQYAARRFAQAARAAGARVHLDEFEGGHRGTSHRYETSLPWLVDALTRE